MSEKPPRTLELFYSYAPSDKRYCDKLEKYLKPLERDYSITSWHQQKIVPGKDRVQEIDIHLNTAQIILLLISPDFIANEYYYNNEIQRAMERHKAGSARVIPILLYHVDWRQHLFPHSKYCLTMTGRSLHGQMKGRHCTT